MMMVRLVGNWLFWTNSFRSYILLATEFFCLLKWLIPSTFFRFVVCFLNFLASVNCRRALCIYIILNSLWVKDFLELRKYTYERLDGSVRAEERFSAIRSFSRQQVKGILDSESNQHGAFVFMISTRAGGVGLNLVSADTVSLENAIRDWLYCWNLVRGYGR